MTPEFVSTRIGLLNPNSAILAGAFQPPVNYTVGSASLIVAGDFNGDGKLDVALGQYNS